MIRTALPRNLSLLAAGLAITFGCATHAFAAAHGPATTTLWKVRIDSSGVWQLPYARLATQGWPAGVPIASVRAFRREYAPSGMPPWNDVPVPIEVLDQDADEVFGAADAVVIPMQNWVDRAHPSNNETRWGESDVVWLSPSYPTTALRISTAPGWLAAANPARPSRFLSTRRYQRRFYYDSSPRDTLIDPFTWTSGFDDQVQSDSITADLLDLDPSGGVVTVGIHWLGRRTGVHAVSAEWRNGMGMTTTLADSVVFANKNPLFFQASFAPGLASEGLNRLRIRGSSTSGPGTGAGLQFFDVSYPRQLVARNDGLMIADSTLADTVELVIRGFHGSLAPTVYAYDLTDPVAVTRLIVDPAQVEPDAGAWRARVQTLTQARPQRRYFIGSVIPTLPADAVAADEPSNLYAGAGAEFIVIGADSLLPDLTALKLQRQYEGLSVLLAGTEHVYDEFNGGRKSPLGIRRFLRFAFSHWGARYALLVGRASEDPRGWLGTSDPDEVPSRIVPSAVQDLNGIALVANDRWFGAGLGSDAEPAPSFLPDLAVGRWPVASRAELVRLVQRAILFNPPLRAQVGVVAVADDRFATAGSLGGGGPSYCLIPSMDVFQGAAESIVTDAIASGVPTPSVRRLYLTNELADVPTFSGLPCDSSRDLPETQAITHARVTPKLIDSLSAGPRLVVFLGNASPWFWTHENLLITTDFEDDTQSLTNATRPFVLMAQGPSVNAFGLVSKVPNGRCTGERFLLASGGGAIGVFGSVGLDLLPLTPYSTLSRQFARALFEFSSSGDGPRRLGDVASIAVQRWFVEVGGDASGMAAANYCLLGDPTAPAAGPPTLVSVGPESGSLQARSWPNPARGPVQFQMWLGAQNRGAVSVFDVTGRRVHAMTVTATRPHWAEGVWNLRDDEGHAVGAGLYLVQFKAEGRTTTRRIVVVP